MFNAITTFGTSQFYVVVALNIVAIVVWFAMMKPMMAAAKEIAPDVYGTKGYSIQLLLSVASGFVPFLNIFNLVMFGIAMTVYGLARRNYGEAIDAFIAKK